MGPVSTKSFLTIHNYKILSAGLLMSTGLLMAFLPVLWIEPTTTLRHDLVHPFVQI